MTLNGDSTSFGSGKVILLSRGVIELTGFPSTGNGHSGGGTIANSAVTAASPTGGASDQNSSFLKDIQNGSGPVALTKNGTSSLSRSGNNTLPGATNISSGSMWFANAGPDTRTNLHTHHLQLGRHSIRQPSCSCLFTWEIALITRNSYFITKSATTIRWSLWRVVTARQRTGVKWRVA